MLVFHFSVAVNVFHLHLVRDEARCSWRRDIRHSICGQTVLTKLGLGLMLQLSPESSQLQSCSPCTFLPPLCFASPVTRPAGRQLRKLSWLQHNLPKIRFQLASLHEAAQRGDGWEFALTCGWGQAGEHIEAPLACTMQPPASTGPTSWRVPACF